MNKVAIAFAVLSVGLVVSLSAKEPSVLASTDSDPSSPEFYTTQVAPIFQASCARCHGGANHRGGLSIETKESLLKGGRSGPVIVPGHPEQSLMIKLLKQTDLAEGQRPMPLNGKLSDDKIQTIADWIKAGANIPSK